MYSVKISEQAEKDLRGIFEYIGFVLESPQYAAQKIKKLDEAILKLDYMPERYRRYEKEPWCSLGIRKMPVDNYNVFYVVNGTEKEVTVVRILYNKRNEEAQLMLLDNLKSGRASGNNGSGVLQEDSIEYNMVK